MNPQQELTKLLRNHDNIQLAMIFGSRSNQTNRPDSDLDLAILCNTAITEKFKMQIIEQASQLYRCPIDLIDLSTVGEPLLGEVLQGRVLFEKNHAHAQLITKHLIDAEDFLPLRKRILDERRNEWIN